VLRERAVEPSDVRTGVAAKLRGVGALLSLGCVAWALYAYHVLGHRHEQWWLLGTALALSLLWQRGIVLTGSAPEVVLTPASRQRTFFGAFATVCGVALWTWGSQVLYQDWVRNFDSGWLAWLIGAVLLSVGTDAVWGRWSHVPGTSRSQLLYLLLLLVVAAAASRIGTLALFPGSTHITQIEELQIGSFGEAYLRGSRMRWEFLSHVWLAALGIGLGGPNLLAMRMSFAAASVLKTIPLFLWLRFAVGTPGALVGTALFTFSFWDVLCARIPTNHDTLAIAIAFALLAGPARRGRPSSYVWLGFLGGYALYQYVAFRPLTVFVLIGAVLISVRDVSASWMRRLIRPLITLALIVSMGIPLFMGVLRGPRFRAEYLDGWNRARVQAPYYNPHDSWTQSLTKRIDRSFAAAGLLFFAGDPSPVHNVGGQPMLDPCAAALLLIGVGYGIVHLARGVFGLTVVALAVTLAGTLVVTGNWDVIRASAAVIYVYALVGYGAASLVAVLSGAWQRIGRVCAVTLLTAGVLVAGYLNTKTVVQFSTSPFVRKAEFMPLAYLQVWLRKHVHNGERVEGISPLCPHALGPNDGAWLRGREMPGILTPDVESALRDWSRHGGPALLLAYAGPSTLAVKEYLEWLFPGLQMQFEEDPIDEKGAIAYARLPGPPADLADRLTASRCGGALSTYEVIGSTGEVLARITAASPFIDPATWPSAVGQATNRSEGKATQIKVDSKATFRVQKPGPYKFVVQTYAGQAELRVDGERREALGNSPIHLDSGKHTLEINGRFSAIEPALMLFWRGPDSGDKTELMPLYRLVEADPTCAPEAPPPTSPS
jgi:hypothetical protein